MTAAPPPSNPAPAVPFEPGIHARTNPALPWLVNPGGGPSGPWRAVPDADWSNWKWQQAHRLRRRAEFEATVGLTADEGAAFEACSDRFDVAVTPYYASLMRPPGQPCPIRAQALPHAGELLTFDFELEDPLAEEDHMPVPGITYRYPDRILFYLTHNCPVYCRHCTRKRKVADPESAATRDQIDEGLAWIERTPTVRDVLLSGGDPLTLSDERLEFIFERLARIPHVEVVRLGTRNPVTLPQRVTPDLARVLARVRPLYVHTHFNHPAECTEAAALALERLADAGCVLGNQMVLLRGVNDDAETVLAMNRWLLQHRCRPYYMFQADMAQGITHFRTPLATGLAIVDALRGRISGMGVPHFAVDLPAGGGKITLTPDYLIGREGAVVTFRNARGVPYRFHDVDDTPGAEYRAASDGVLSFSSCTWNTRMTHERRGVLDIPWEMLDTVVEGRSAIDVPRLYVTGLADAEDFLRGYGFDLQRSDEAREVESVRAEAIDFMLHDLLCDEPHLDMPAEIRDEPDVRRLLLWASQPHVQPRQRWACALLRVMHTYAHCGSYFQDLYGDQIREQIRARFVEHLHRTSTELTLGTGPDAIPLLMFQLRGRKSRRSIAMKLLHKAENVSADVFDWIGLRFVTEHRFDALLVARYLRMNSVIMFANVRPGRSRNTLIDTQAVRLESDRMQDEIRAGRMAEYERLAHLREFVAGQPYPEEPARSYNPYSAAMYHSIQFTCSQQIRVANPHLASLRKRLAQSSRFDVIARSLDRFGVQTGINFFFPYEVQVMDVTSFERSRTGRASHGEYKARQRHAVKKRLWGDWIGDEVRPLPESFERRTEADSDLVTLSAPGFSLT